jgi:hypothetical protein
LFLFPSFLFPSCMLDSYIQYCCFCGLNPSFNILKWSHDVSTFRVALLVSYVPSLFARLFLPFRSLKKASLNYLVTDTDLNRLKLVLNFPYTVTFRRNFRHITHLSYVTSRTDHWMLDWNRIELEWTENYVLPYPGHVISRTAVNFSLRPWRMSRRTCGCCCRIVQNLTCSNEGNIISERHLCRHFYFWLRFCGSVLHSCLLVYEGHVFLFFRCSVKVLSLGKHLSVYGVRQLSFRNARIYVPSNSKWVIAKQRRVTTCLWPRVVCWWSK